MDNVVFQSDNVVQCTLKLSLYDSEQNCAAEKYENENTQFNGSENEMKNRFSDKLNCVIHRNILFFCRKKSSEVLHVNAISV
jgi:hypothetical protein